MAAGARSQSDPYQRIAELEFQITDLEAALDHYAHDREAATHVAIRNQVDVARFGAGAVLRAARQHVLESNPSILIIDAPADLVQYRLGRWAQRRGILVFTRWAATWLDHAMQTRIY